jgi:hypothetical protein
MEAAACYSAEEVHGEVEEASSLVDESYRLVLGRRKVCETVECYHRPQIMLIRSIASCRDSKDEGQE